MATPDERNCRDSSTLDALPGCVVEGHVVSISQGLGLAHIESADGALYGVRRGTPGIEFESLGEGQRLRCVVTQKFHRVLRATLVDPLA